MLRIRIHTLLACAPALLLASCSKPVAVARFPARVHDFGKVVQGARVEHAFAVENGGTADLVLDRVEPAKGVEVEAFDRVVPAGGRGQIRVAFDTTDIQGQGQLAVRVQTNDPETPRTVLALKGRVVSLLELTPKDRIYFLSKVRGEGGQEKLILIHHGKGPVALREVTSDSPHIRAQARPLEPGRRYEIAVALDPETPAGRHEATVTLATDRPDQPAVKIPVRALVEEAVSARPGRVSFGRLGAGALDNEILRRRQILVVRHRGSGFQVLGAEASLPWLEVRVEPKETGKSYLVSVSMVAEKAPRGEIRGRLTIRTNDPAFPRLELPIQGSIL